jgi:histidyl-tRNA synthetase
VVYEIAPHLVRGLDYYRHTAFEFVTDRLGAQGTVLGGGRYDGLIETLGGPHTPAVGWAAGIERLGDLLHLEKAVGPDVALISEAKSETAIALVNKIAKSCRDAGVEVHTFDTGPSRRRYDRAKRVEPRTAIIVADHLLREGQVAHVRLRTFEGFLSELPRVALSVEHALASSGLWYHLEPEFDLKGGDVEVYAESPF